jgi:hypothetical protein
MKSKLRHSLALAGLALTGMILAASSPGLAEVQRIELDVTGYLCGL